MAKTVKLPLEMSNGVMVRTIEELKENFDIKKIVGYFSDGKLSKWLESRYYEEELEKVNELSEDDSELAKKLCDIFGVEYIEDVKIDIKKIKEEQERLLKLKKYTDEEDVISNIENVAFNQEELLSLYEKDISKIYLCEGEFLIPEDKRNIIYKMIGTPSVEGLFKTTDGHSDINEELALLIGDRNHVESERFVMWKSANEYNSKDSVFFKSKNAVYSTKDICVWDKIENKYYTAQLKQDGFYFSFTLIGFIGDFLLVEAEPNFTEKYVYFYKNINDSFKYASKKLLLKSADVTIDDKNMAYMPYGALKIFIFNFDNKKDIDTGIEYSSSLISAVLGFKHKFKLLENKLFYIEGHCIYEYDLNNCKKKLIYENSKVYIRNLLCFKNDELFIEYIEETSHRTILCGIKNGIITEYIGGSMNEKDKINYNTNSNFIIFPKGSGLHILNVNTKEVYKISLRHSMYHIVNYVGNYLLLKFNVDYKTIAIDLSNLSEEDIKAKIPLELQQDFTQIFFRNIGEAFAKKVFYEGEE